MLRRFSVVFIALCLVASSAALVPATTYTITDLGNLGGTNVSNVAGTANVNGTQVVVGSAGAAWYWENGTMTSLATTLTTLAGSNGYAGSSATGINANGVIVGTYTDTSSTTHGFAVTLNATGGIASAVNVLPLSGGYFQTVGSPNVNSVNASGQVFAECMQGISPTSLCCIANTGGTAATLISSVGYTPTGGMNASGWTTAKDSPDCMVYNNGSGTWGWTDIGELYTTGSYGYGMDAAGDVVGGSGIPGGSATKGAPYYSAYLGGGSWATMVNLGNLSSFSSAYVYGAGFAINNGTIVGYEFNGTRSLPTEYAFLSGTTNGSMVALQTLVPSFASSNFGSGRLSMADDIGGNGDIVGVGITNSAADDAFLLTPTPEPSTLLLVVSGLVGLLAYAWRKRK